MRRRSTPSVHPSCARALLVASLVVFSTCDQVRAQFDLSIDIEAPPISYSDTKPNNAVSRLAEQIKDGKTKLKHDPEFGYLPSILEELDIPVSSQSLVFSKTSLQVQYISKRNPRAIYFNDEVYVGWVRGSSLMEISTVDPKLGAAFYTVDMIASKPDIQYATYDCLSCHSTSMTGNLPGHTMRSVETAIDGSLLTQRESFVSDHTSPLSQRWGGWYVTGRHGDMQHMGNSASHRAKYSPRPIESDAFNRMSLRREFDTFGYLSPYSDIVALMVLTHQTRMHNEFVRADFSIRKLKHEWASNPIDETEQNEALSQIAEPVVDHLLFCGEAELTAPVRGSILFRNGFTDRGRKDTKGRSLRDFDMESRMFKYPCSFLIHSQAFSDLDADLKTMVYQKLLRVLTGDDHRDKYAHLSSMDREAISSILVNTHEDIQSAWSPQTIASP